RRKIEHANVVFRFRDLQMISESLRRWIAHGDDSFHELTKKFGAFSFLIHRHRWMAFANDVRQAEPSGNELRRNRRKKSCVGAEFVADKKCSALWCERIFPLAIFFEKIETDKRIHQNF